MSIAIFKPSQAFLFISSHCLNCFLPSSGNQVPHRKRWPFGPTSSQAIEHPLNRSPLHVDRWLRQFELLVHNFSSSTLLSVNRLRSYTIYWPRESYTNGSADC